MNANEAIRKMQEETEQGIAELQRQRDALTAEIEERKASIPARFHDPAYAKAERKVARTERSIRRNVR